MNELENLKETILKDAPRFTENDGFRFSCRKGLNCFTQCCADVNIFLTPYDILRMKTRLGISSEEFLAQYTLVPFNDKQQLPVVILKMADGKDKRCPFVTSEGCTIYEDRPWSCRMYPLGLASPKEGACAGEQKFYFLMEESHCHGFGEAQEWTVRDWLDDQGIAIYDEMGEFFKEITLHDYFKRVSLDPEKMEMFYMACYDLDRFKRFVFESRFFQYFDIDPELVERIRNDDVEMMKFAFQWLRFAMMGEPTIKIRGDVLESRKQRLFGDEKKP